MSYTSWHVGMKVVCAHEYDVRMIRARGSYCARCKFPVVGCIYTIRRVGVVGGQVGVLLEEIVNPIGNPNLGFDGESGFRARDFRPVQTRKTDISIFTAMLHDEKEHVRA